MKMAHLGSRKIRNVKDLVIDKRGLGDTIEAITAVTGIKTVVKLAADALGVEDCGCDKRRDALNRIFPYKIESNVTPKTSD